MKIIIKWVKSLFKKEKTLAETPEPEIIDVQRNVIYPNDKHSQIRMSIWLDDVIEKHHGGWLPPDDDDRWF